MKNLFILLLITALFITFSEASFAQKVTVLASPSKPVVKKGEEFTIDAKVTISENWYIYAFKDQVNKEGIGPTTSEVEVDDKLLQIQKTRIKFPKSKTKYDEGFEMDVEYHAGTVNLSIPVKALADIDFNNQKLFAGFFLQLCSDEGKCIPPQVYKGLVKAQGSKLQEPKQGNSYKKIMYPEEKDELVTDDNSKIMFKASPSKSNVAAGEKFTIRLRLTLDEYWYTYSLKEQLNKEGIGPTMTEIIIDSTQFLKLSGDIKSPKPKIKFDKGFETDIEIFEHTADFEIPVEATSAIDFSKDEKFIGIYIQLCDTARCLPPEEYKIYITSEVYIAQAEAANQDVQLTDSQKEIEAKKKEGIFSFLWFAMSMGALALLTPCVFPMVPITVSFFTKRAEKAKGNGLRDSLIYALGIIFTFTALGFILALILGSTGIQDFATNPWVNISIAAIFIIFALNLFGAFEIQIPPALLNKLNSKSQGSGIMSVLLMGLTFSLTSFTCTVPFVGSSLISAAGGEWFYPIIGMLGFSAVFAAPFFLLALFPSFMQKLPKAVGWMNNVKVVMGFLEIAAAIKFISNVDLVWSLGIMPREMFLAIWIGCAVLITLYILGTFRLPHDSDVNGVSSPRLIFAILFSTITIYLWSGLYGKSLGELDAFLPPPDYEQLMSPSTGSIQSSGPENSNPSGKTENNASAEISSDWLTDYKQALKIAKESNKSLFIDFTGFTCTNCRWMETKMFVKPEIDNLIGQYVKVRLYTDRQKEPYISNKMLQMEKFNSIELPLYVILKPDGELVGTKAFTRDENEFITFLKSGLKM